jgi:alpha-galactosidase
LRAPAFFAALLATLFALCLAGAAFAQEAGDPNFIPASRDPNRTANGLAMTPPMGWNSWNGFGCKIDEKAVRDNADAIAANGMKAAGYQFIIIDDCWQVGRDASGNIVADPAHFPSGMKALADYVHSRGLKFGLYSDAGAKTCQGRPGSQGHEFQDAAQYARWGVDYLKYDWCEAHSRNAEEAYALMADALRATGRPIVFAMCEWGLNKPWLWAEKIGNTRRTTGDLQDVWSATLMHQQGLLQIVELNEPLWSYAGPGHWNDADMLQVGNGGMTTAEYRSQFSLWAMMASPLIAGNDVAHMDRATHDILLNTEVIAVNQDATGVQGRRISSYGAGEVWTKPLTGKRQAVLLFNHGDAATPIGFNWEDVGWEKGPKPKLRDVWAHRDVPATGKRFLVKVPAHDVVMLVVGA